MKQLICSTSWYGVGCTFLDWSIHYLSGQLTYYNTDLGWIPLTDNPLTGPNAHAHQRNHPNGLLETQQCVAELHENTNLGSWYTFPLNQSKVKNILDLGSLHNFNPEKHATIVSYSTQDYQDTLGWMARNNVKIIYVSLSPELPLYAMPRRNLKQDPLEVHPCYDPTNIELRVNEVFFTFNHRRFESKNIWDIRSAVARIEAIQNRNTTPDIEFDFPHFWIDSRELWYNGEQVMQDILKWTDLKLDPSRLSSWIEIYRQWQSVHHESLTFQYRIKHIVDAIINNWHCEIDLSFEQEIVVQNYLIHQHNVDLDTQGLVKFPNNTTKLHKLLISNSN